MLFGGGPHVSTHRCCEVSPSSLHRETVVLGTTGGESEKQRFVRRVFAIVGLVVPGTARVLSCYTELIGGSLLTVGLLTRPAAFAVMINMLIATIVMLPKGFFAGGA